ncbi:hypothetical protein BDN72DRAFT_848854 [Pluteus cervinus]|uniref:Uncharacterized protein n=1 Tax=Pluteus cervinus TaxID=181527 RepID=A0ACD3A977_9AGAR|nr:hypothetical protein BDN72DRAFT_848854 [Pluteus cervinus]
MPAVRSPQKSRNRRSRIAIKPHKESRLLFLPAELLSDILKSLSWRDVMRARLTCTRLRKISKTAWRSIARQEPRNTWWLDKSVDAHTEDELEFLYVRRQNAEIGFAMLAKGASPRQRTVSVGELGTDSHYLLPGGRWLLLSTHMGSILYFDLAASDIRANVLIPEQPFQCAALLCPDQDASSPTLRFHLGLVRQDIDSLTPQEPLEVWKVDVVCDDTGGAVGLRAVCLKSFMPEPPGYIVALSLLGDSLAYSHRDFDRPMTAVVSWKSIEGPNYPKRVFFPSGTSCARLLPNNLLFSTCKHGACVIPISSLPEATVIASFDNIKETFPATIAELHQPKEHMVSDSMLYGDTARLVMWSNAAIRGLAVDCQMYEKGLPSSVKTLKFADTARYVEGKISASGDFILMWDRRGGLVLHHVSWFDDQVVRTPCVRVDQSAPLSPPGDCTCVLDIVSGRIVVEQPDGVFLILDLTLLEA